MFPTIIEDNSNNNQPTREKIISTSTELGFTPSFNYENKQIILENGSPKLISNVEAVRQWIVLFVTTPKNTYKIFSDCILACYDSGCRGKRPCYFDV